MRCGAWRSDYSCSESPRKGLPTAPQGSPVVETQEGFVTVNTGVGRMLKVVCLLPLLLLEQMGTPRKGNLLRRVHAPSALAR